MRLSTAPEAFRPKPLTRALTITALVA